MADYCAVADVQVHRPQHAITAESKPTIAQVTSEITRLSAYVDGKLATAGFVVPVVSGTVTLDYLKTAVSFGVAGVIESQQKAGYAAELPGFNQVKNHYWDIFLDMLKTMLEEPSGFDAPRSTSDEALGTRGAVIESYFTRNPDADPDLGVQLTGNAVPRFSIGQKF